MSGDENSTPSTDIWLDGKSPFPSVHGYEEAAELLNDSRLHVDYQSLFVAAGASQGRAGAAGKRSLLNLNGEEHRRLRSEIASGFRPRSVDRVRPFCRATAEELLHELPCAEPFEFMQRFAKPYIERTTGQYIGFPLADIDSLSKPLALMAEAIADLANRASDFDAGCTELLDYATEALLARRDEPTDDVLGQLSRLIKSNAIDELFAANLIVTLLSAGLEPTIFQLGLLVEEFSKLPTVWNSVASDDSLAPRVLEELLRFRSTNQGVARCVHEEVTQHQVHFEKGSNIIINIAGANHDPRRFARPDAFDIDANRGSHLAFGFGPHHCLGAPLVRAQLQEALQVLAAQLVCPVVLNVKTKKGQGLTGPMELIIEIERRCRG
jgi:cytochrome P450